MDDNTAAQITILKTTNTLRMNISRTYKDEADDLRPLMNSAWRLVVHNYKWNKEEGDKKRAVIELTAAQFTELEELLNRKNLIIDPRRQTWEQILAQLTEAK